MIFLRIDLSQAEDRMLGILSKDPDLINLARRPPDEYDAYRDFAQRMLGRDEVKPRERQAFKRIKLGTNYGVEAETMSRTLLSDRITVDAETCGRVQKWILHAMPGIGKYQDEMRLRVITERKLRNPFGRVIEFPYDRLEPGLYRRGYAWPCQSTVHDLLQQQGLIPLWEFLAGDGIRENLPKAAPKSRLNLENHDELLVSVVREEAWPITVFTVDSLSAPRDYEGVEFSMPCSVVLETRYHAEAAPEGTPFTAWKEWKKLPRYEEFIPELNRIWEQRMP